MEQQLTNADLIKVLGKNFPELDQKALDFFMTTMDDNKTNGDKKIKDVGENLSEEEQKVFFSGYNTFVFLAKIIETYKHKTLYNTSTVLQ